MTFHQDHDQACRPYVGVCERHLLSYSVTVLAVCFQGHWAGETEPIQETTRTHSNSAICRLDHDHHSIGFNITDMLSRIKTIPPTGIETHTFEDDKTAAGNLLHPSPRKEGKRGERRGKHKTGCSVTI